MFRGDDRGLVHIPPGTVEDLPFPDASFDAVVDTFSLCVFPRPVRALEEMARVVKPDGRLLLLEHARSELAPLALYQDITAGAVAASGKGCIWNQDVSTLVQQSGLVVTYSQHSLAGLITLMEARRSHVFAQ
jgi:methyltransferase OMS1, mitochondrial